MNKREWKDLQVDCLRVHGEQERFELFSNAIHDKDGNIFFVGQLLQRAATLYPDHTALVCLDQKISYKDLYHRSVLLSKKLIARGVKPKDRVLILFQNSLEFYVAYFGVLQAGAVVAPLNIFLKERELNHIVQDAQASLIIATSQKVGLFKNGNLPDILTEKDLELDTPLTETIADFDVICLPHDDLAVLLYTSGTTGLPKGVMLSSKNIMTNVVQMMSRLPICTAQRIFCVLPLFHSFAQNTCIWAAFYSGCSVIVVPKIQRKGILDGLKHKPTIFLGVPALYGLLCLLRNAPLDSVDFFISGGDALPDKIRAAFELIYRRKLCNGYGLTETAPLISVDLEDVAEPTNNIGRPAIGIQCSIRDENNKDMPKGEIGQLWVKGNNVMMGYYNEPEKTAEVLQDGWFATGDLAKFDDNGKLLICGREKDLIIHKGLNIYPQEIENVLLGHMKVLFVGVVGKQDEQLGEIPVAFVQLQPGKKKEGMAKVLRDLCAKDLASYKIPRSFIFIDDMPLTATKKVDKKDLKKRLEKKQ